MLIWRPQACIPNPDPLIECLILVPLASSLPGSSPTLTFRLQTSAHPWSLACLSGSCPLSADAAYAPTLECPALPCPSFQESYFWIKLHVLHGPDLELSQATVFSGLDNSRPLCPWPATSLAFRILAISSHLVRGRSAEGSGSQC